MLIHEAPRTDLSLAPVLPAVPLSARSSQSHSSWGCTSALSAGLFHTLGGSQVFMFLSAESQLLAYKVLH